MRRYSACACKYDVEERSFHIAGDVATVPNSQSLRVADASSSSLLAALVPPSERPERKSVNVSRAGLETMHAKDRSCSECTLLE